MAFFLAEKHYCMKTLTSNKHKKNSISLVNLGIKNKTFSLNGKSPEKKIRTSHNISPWVIKFLTNGPINHLVSLSQFPEILQARISEGEYSMALMLIENDGALSHYKNTGEIQDSLLTFFNQDGIWQCLWKPKDHNGFPPLDKEVIPKERLVKEDETGHLHLMTSFYNRGTEELEFSYSSIKGNLDAPYAKSLFAPQLGHIGGWLNMYWAQEIYTPQLRATGGQLNGTKAKSITAPRLTHTGGCLGLGAKTILLPQLRFTIGSLYLPNAKRVFTPQLNHVGGDIYANNAEIFDAPKLKEVNGSIPKTCLKHLDAPQLFEVQRSTTKEDTFNNVNLEIKQRHHNGACKPKFVR